MQPCSPVVYQVCVMKEEAGMKVTMKSQVRSSEGKGGISHSKL